MEMSMYLARLLAAIYLIVGVGMLFNKEYYVKMTKNFYENEAVMYLGGVMALVIGLLLVMEHNIWEQNWTVLVTIIAWLSLLKGILFMLFPKMMKKRLKFYMEPGRLEKYIAIPLILGLVFAYFGFMG